MEQEDHQPQQQEATSSIQFISADANPQSLAFTIQTSDQLNIVNQQDPSAVQQSNQEQVTYYFRDSDQSEWSSSDDDDDAKEKEDSQKIQIEQEENEGEGDQSTKKQKKNKQKARRFEEDFLEEDDNQIDPKGEQMKTKNEIKPQKFDKTETDGERLVRYGIQFKGNETLVEIGSVMQIVDDKIIIATNNDVKEEDKRIILDLDNIIFNEHRNVIGTVEDVFGNIKSPFYCLIVDKYMEDMIAQKKIEVGQKMYMIEGYNKLLMKAQLEFLLRQKGCDASNRFDEEVLNDHEVEFSDDEMESRAKNKKSNKERKQDLEDVEDEVRTEEKVQNPKKEKKNKKIMVMKNENGVLKRIFLKPSEFESLKSNPNNKIQQLPTGFNSNKPPKQNNPNNQQQFSIPSGQNPYHQKQNYHQNKQYRNNNNNNNNNGNYQQQNFYGNQQNYQGQQQNNQNYQYQQQQQQPYSQYQSNQPYQQQFGYPNQQSYGQNNQIPQQQFYQNNEQNFNQNMQYNNNNNNNNNNFQNSQNFNNPQQQQIPPNFTPNNQNQMI